MEKCCCESKESKECKECKDCKCENDIISWKKIDKKDHKKAKKEIEIAASVYCGDWDPLHQEIMKGVMLDVIKRTCDKDECKDCPCHDEKLCCGDKCVCGHKCPEECPENCPCGCKDRKNPMCHCYKGDIDFVDHVRNLNKFFMGYCKGEVMKMADVALECFKKVKGFSFPEEGKMKEKCLKSIRKLLYIYHKKGFCQKEIWEKLGIEFWSKRSEERDKKMKHKFKKFVKKVLYYTSTENDKLYQKAACKAIIRAMITTFKAKMRDLKAKFKEEKKECHKFGKMCKDKKFCKGKFIKEHLKSDGVKFITEFMKGQNENIKNALQIARENVFAFAKELKEGKTGAYPLWPQKKQVKTICKIVCECICAAGTEKKSNEFFVDIANRYIKGCVCTCDKKCIKCCRKLFETAIMLNGIKDEAILAIGSRWGGIMCCQNNGKTGCQKEACADFATKWIKDFMPIVSDAVGIAKEIMKDCACKQGCGEYEKKRKCRRMILKYLQLHCIDGKLDKENFTGYLKICKEKMHCKKEEKPNTEAPKVNP